MVYVLCYTGYRESLDEYYSLQVRNILNSVIASLVQNQQHTFIWEEVSFFQKWWTDPQTTSNQKLDVQNLVAQGRLEFVGK